MNKAFLAGITIMTTIIQGFHIENVHITWGTLLKDAKDILSKLPQYPPYGGWSNIRCACSSVFGLKSTMASIRAPFDDRPVMQVSYELVPSGDATWGKLHRWYVDQLTRTLGQPVKSESLYRDHNPDNTYVSGGVVYSAGWLFGDVRISLSVYGGIRQEETGDAAAGLFIDWINEKKAAGPFISKNSTLEQELSVYLADSRDIQLFTLTDKQRKFYLTHIDIGDPDVTKDEGLRLAQLALYRNDLVQSPEYIRRLLNENEIAVKFIAAERRMVIANKWDATVLDYSKNERISFTELLPARGSGRYHLQVKDLTIIDSRESDTLLRLVAHFESITGVQINRETGYDD